jgi:hypothetical protein
VTQRHGVWNGSRFRQEDLGGFYESDFQRANHSDRPLAFWIRYTAFRSEGRPDRALGELWAIYFDGETSRITAVKEAVPIYERAFPKAKAPVGTPNAVYTGTLTVDGHEIPIDGWRGSQNHNWGSRHTDNYAWGQVAGFNGAPDAFLECATAQLKLGPFWTPRLTLVVLREREAGDCAQRPRASCAGVRTFRFLHLDDRYAELAGTHLRPYSCSGERFCWGYQNPPGGEKTCLNTKLASAELTVERRGRPSRRLTTRHRAAFEILTSRTDHGVPVVV